MRMNKKKIEGKKRKVVQPQELYFGSHSIRKNKAKMRTKKFSKGDGKKASKL